jgi:hypothetical protein
VLHVESNGVPQHAYSGGQFAQEQEFSLDIPLEPVVVADPTAVSCPTARGPDVSGRQGIAINGVS